MRIHAPIAFLPPPSAGRPGPERRQPPNPPAEPAPARRVEGEVLPAPKARERAAVPAQSPGARVFAYVQSLGSGDFLDVGGRLDLYA